MISIRNIVVLAIMQAGVIVAGVLAAGLCHHVYTSNGMAIPGLAATLYNFGVLGLMIPLAWVTGAVALQLRADVPDNARVLMFWTGVLILAALAVFVVYADVSPWLRITLPHLNGGDDNGGGE